MSSVILQVAVGIIINDTDHVLVTRRPHDVHQGGFWEFPGGKLEPGEDVSTALARELHEELGVVVKSAHVLLRLPHAYTDRTVILHVCIVNKWEGEPYSREGQPVQWVPRRKLQEYKFLPADAIIVRSLQLPPLYLIIPGPNELSRDDYCGRIEDCIRAGARLLQLRCHEETWRRQPELVTGIQEICRLYNAVLMLNSSPAMAVYFNVDGLHLSSARLLQLRERPVPKHFWLSASCHNLTEVMQAKCIDVDFIVLSPVQKTTSHPGAQALGWDKFAELVEAAVRPVYALGGMEPYHLPAAWNCGAQGVAILSAVWSARMPTDVIRQCLETPRYN